MTNEMLVLIKRKYRLIFIDKIKNFL